MSRVVYPGLLVVLAAMLATTSCKCGKDEVIAPDPGGAYERTVDKLPASKEAKLLGLIPAEAELVAMGEDLSGFWSWAEPKLWIQELKKSPFAEDLHTTGWMARLSTWRHRLQTASPVALKGLAFADLLSTPTALAVVQGADGPRWLLVKQVDLRVQALDRLVEALNQVKAEGGAVESHEARGLSVRELKSGEETVLSYAIYSNLLLASNDAKLLDRSMALAAGEAKDSLANVPHLGSAAGQTEGGKDLTLLVRLGQGADELGRLASLLPRPDWVLRIPAADPVRVAITAVGPEEKTADAPSVLTSCLPLDSRLVLSLSKMDMQNLGRRFFEGDFGKQLAKLLKTDMARFLTERFTGEGALVVLGLDKEVPFFDLALLVKTSAPELVEKAASQVFGHLFGKVRPYEAKNLVGVAIKQTQTEGGLRPAFSMLEGGVLVIGSRPQAVEHIARVVKGQQPALTDLARFQEAVLSKDRAYGMAGFVNGENLFEDLKDYARKMVKQGGRFDDSTVEETLVPIFDAMKHMGKLGGFLASQPSALRGQLVTL